MPSPYDEENEELLVDSSKEAYDVLLDAVDSIHPVSKSNEVLNAILKQRSEALLMTEETAYFYKTQLKEVPIETEVVAIKLLRRVLFLLHKNNNEERLRMMIKQLSKKLKKTNDPESMDRLAIERRRIQDIWESYIYEEGKKPEADEEVSQGEINWREKVTRYVAYCIDGGLLYEDFNLT